MSWYSTFNSSASRVSNSITCVLIHRVCITEDNGCGRNIRVSRQPRPVSSVCVCAALSELLPCGHEPPCDDFLRSKGQCKEVVLYKYGERVCVKEVFCYKYEGRVHVKRWFIINM